MKKYTSIMVFCFLLSTGYSQAIRWATKSVSPGTKNEFAWSVISDSLGNTIIGGYFTDSVYFGSTMLKTKGLKDAFVAKLDQNGNYLWAKSFGSSGDDEAYSVAVDNAGNVYATGYYTGTLHLSPTDSLITQGQADIFITKMNSSGTVSFKTFAGFGTNDYGRGIACNTVSGEFAMVGDVNNGASFITQSFYANGTARWSDYSSGGSAVSGSGIAMDNSSYVHIIGSYSGTMTSPANMGSSLSDIYFMSFQANGGLDYSTSYGGSGNDYGYSIHCNGAGDKFYLSGAFTYSLYLSSSVSVSGSSGQSYGYVTQLNKVGIQKIPQWAKRSTSTNTPYYGVKADRWGNVFVCNRTNSNIYAYASYGNAMWTSAPTVSTATAVCNSLAPDKYGNIYAAGKIITSAGGGTLTFGDSTFVNPGNNASAFVEKISRPVISAPNPGTNACISSQRGDSVIMTINASMNYNAGNVFTLQMDATGAGTFASPVTIGTLTTTTGGVFHAYIPPGVGYGSTIDFRVLSSNPPTTSGEQDYVKHLDRPIAVVSTDTLKKCPASTATVSVNDTSYTGGISGMNILWTPSSGLSSTTNSLVSVSYPVNNTYSVTLTDMVNGCKDGKSVYLLNYPAPSIVVNDTFVCRGSSVTLHAAVATNIVTYTWTPSGTLTGSGTANPVSTPTAYITNYNVVGTTAKGCTAQDAFQVTSPQTTANAGPVSYNTCLGGGVQLSGSSVGTSTSTQHYLWTPASGLNDATIKNPVATPTVTTKYLLVATDTINGCKGKDSINIIVGPIGITANNGTVTCGSAVTLTATATGGSYITPLTYSWSPASHLSVTTGTTTSANPIGTTTYYVTVTTGNGCSGTAPAKVTVNPASFGLNFSATSQLLTTPPFVAQFTNSTPSPSNYTFTWLFGDGITQQTNNGTVFHTYSYNGNYDVTLIAVNNTTGCVDTLVKGGYIFCTGGTGCALTASVTPVSGTTACVGDTVWLASNTGSGYTYQWNLNGSVISGATSSTYGATVPGNYAVTISNGACSVISQPKNVTFNNPPPTPTITATGNINTCGGGGSVILSSTAGYASYLWSTSATTQNIIVSTPGVYVVHVGSGTAGCTSSASYTVNAAPVTPPSICMVTTDSTSTNNIVYWDKTIYPSAQMDSMIIYREVSTNTYKRIGAVSKDSLSMFVDVNRSVGPANGDPNIGSYRYKLQVRDSCGVYSALGPYHNSVWFNDQQTGTFTWNQYEVEFQTTPVVNFNLMRDSANIGDWRIIGSVAGTQISLNDPTYSTYQFVGNWRVEATGFTCSPTMRLINGSTQSTIVKSKSNITNNRTTSIKTMKSAGVSVYPNPATSALNIRFANQPNGKISVKVTSILGEEISNQTIEKVTDIINLDLSKYESGIYLIHISGANLNEIKRFVKQ